MQRAGFKLWDKQETEAADKQQGDPQKLNVRSLSILGWPSEWRVPFKCQDSIGIYCMLELKKKKKRCFSPN